MTSQSTKTVDREMMIIFVYDSQMLQKEDDPSTAILYFHPTWVSDQQKTALCGQLMGTVHCIKSIFSVPKIVSLQSEKFFVKEYSRYLMDIEMMSKLYDNNAKLSAKLVQVMYFWKPYKYYSVVKNSITVVATQLSSDVTKRIVLTDPYRIKCPAEVPTVNFELPLGAQLPNLHFQQRIFQIMKKRRRLQTKSVTSAMKRDQSIIFTAVPEKDSDHSLVIKTEKPSGSQNRPKFLNLKNKTTDVDVKKPVSNTPFYGHTNGKIEEQSDKNLKPVVNGTKNLANIEKAVPYLKITSNLYDRKKYCSMYDVREKMKCINKSITMKYYNMELTEKYYISIDKTPDEVKVFKTITDPNYPIFRPDGTVISHLFYKDYLTNQMELITTEIKERNSREKKSLTLPLKSLSIDGTEQTSPIRRHSSGVLLTPLKSKLSSFDERSSGFCSRDTTPSEFRMFTPTQQPNFLFGFKKPKNFCMKVRTRSINAFCLFVDNRIWLLLFFCKMKRRSSCITVWKLIQEVVYKTTVSFAVTSTWTPIGTQFIEGALGAVQN
ncbi:hypothetical protein BDFB_007730 [Asbolus verrucosus]|uniref:CCZ1/INTU/HSP4 first Longin domain-containing protein n=1 Tax=Asbolus verrucosus TaxID=1661398 RepID=A0A482VGV1_ASBVE|nr:hypothetical protein BDFB_007730 [Asbolus verrucosus]